MINYFKKYFVKKKQAVATGPFSEEGFSTTTFFKGALQNLTGNRLVRNDQGELIVNKRIFTTPDLKITIYDRVDEVVLHQIVAGDVGKYHLKIPGMAWEQTTSEFIGVYVVAYNADDDTGLNFQYDKTDVEFIINNIDNVMYLNKILEIECLERARTK